LQKLVFARKLLHKTLHSLWSSSAAFQIWMIQLTSTMLATCYTSPPRLSGV